MFWTCSKMFSSQVFLIRDDMSDEAHNFKVKRTRGSNVSHGVKSGLAASDCRQRAVTGIQHAFEIRLLSWEHRPLIELSNSATHHLRVIYLYSDSGVCPRPFEEWEITINVVSNYFGRLLKIACLYLQNSESVSSRRKSRNRVNHLGCTRWLLWRLFVEWQRICSWKFVYDNICLPWLLHCLFVCVLLSNDVVRSPHVTFQINFQFSGHSVTRSSMKWFWFEDS